MQPDPEGDAEVSLALGSPMGVEAALVGGLALILLWPVLRLARAVRRRRRVTASGPDA